MPFAKLRHGLLLLAAIAAAGCQIIGGFQGFEGDTAGAPTTTGGPMGAEGMPCETSATCGGDVCVFGFCRVPCKDDADCVKGSICLSDPSGAGCRLQGDAETKCHGQCQNPNLACGIDGTCRTPCSASKSCPINGEACVQNACVGNGETDYQTIWGQCSDVRGETTCGDDGKTITTCNVTKPGKVPGPTCDSAALCQASVRSGSTTCATKVCNPGEYACNGAALQRCMADATGYETIATCASAALCIKGKTLPTPACATPMCGPGAANPVAAKCEGGQLLTCSADQQSFDATGCAPKQCDPGGKQCIDLVIDSKEVTRASYAAFLATNPTTAGQPPGCAWNTSFAPDASCLAGPDVCNPAMSSCDAVPQVCVDWCDAYAYCKSKGLHLCGKLGAPDTMVTLTQSNDPAQSAWMNACSSGGQYAWSEGGSWTPGVEGQACNGSAKTAYANGLAYPSGSLPDCHSPVATYGAVFDMSGNVAEWENSCSIDVKATSASKDDTCRTRGGSFKSGQSSLQCDAHPQDRSRDWVASDIGFRCCG